MKLANFVVVLYLYATPCSFSRASSLGFRSSGSGCHKNALLQLTHVSWSMADFAVVKSHVLYQV